MVGSDPRKQQAVAGYGQRPDGRRHRQLVEAAAVHMIVDTSSDAAPRGRQAIVCEYCRLGITTPGVAIVRGRNVVHVHCAA